MKTLSIVWENAMFASMQRIVTGIKPYGYITGLSTIPCISAGQSRNSGFVGNHESGHQEGDVGYLRNNTIDLALCRCYYIIRRSDRFQPLLSYS